MDRTIVAAEHVITGEHDLADAAVIIEGERVVDVVPASGVAVDTALPGWLIPGFVDVHVHGGAGGSFADPDGARAAIAAHRAHGTTSMVGSLVSTPLADLEHQLPALLPLVESDELIGVHLEGPFLSPHRAGAQNPEVLVAPEAHAVHRLCKIMGGRQALITMAPERTGAAEAIRAFADAGWIVALGHSEAPFDVARTGVDAGAVLITHLFNGMPTPHHRKPGLAELALLDDRVTVELILDGEHLSDPTVELAMRLAADRWIAVTDAIDATGMSDGDYELGGLPVQVLGGVARLSGTDTLAGSTLTMDRAFQRLVEVLGVSPLEAVRGTSTRAADLLGRRDIGRINAGARADMVHWIPDVGVRRVMRRGSWLTSD